MSKGSESHILNLRCQNCTIIKLEVISAINGMSLISAFRCKFDRDIWKLDIGASLKMWFYWLPTASTNTH